MELDIVINMELDTVIHMNRMETDGHSSQPANTYTIIIVAIYRYIIMFIHNISYVCK